MFTVMYNDVSNYIFKLVIIKLILWVLYLLYFENKLFVDYYVIKDKMFI